MHCTGAIAITMQQIELGHPREVECMIHRDDGDAGVRGWLRQPSLPYVFGTAL